jgi:hypothetical protein
MSGYQGRTGPNVSQFLADLNTVPNDFSHDVFDVDPNLHTFTEAEFIDWDADQPDLNLNTTIDFDSIGTEQPSHNHTRRNSATSAPAQPKMDGFTLDGKFSQLVAVLLCFRVSFALHVSAVSMFRALVPLITQ